MRVFRMKSRNPICGCLVRLGASRSEGASCGGPLDPRACLGCPASVSPGRLTLPPPPRACALARPQIARRGMQRASSGVSKHAGLAPALPAAAGQVPATEANPRSGGGWEHAETQDRSGDLQIFGLALSQLSYRGLLSSQHSRHEQLWKHRQALQTANPCSRMDGTHEAQGL